MPGVRPPAGPFEEWTVETPWLDTSGTTDRIVGSEGRTLAEDPVEVNAYTRVYAPFVPDWLWGIEDVKLYNLGDDELVSVPVTADWGTGNRKTDIYDEGLNEFVEEYLVVDDDATIPYETFQQKVQEFFDLRATETPPKNWIGRRLEGVEVDPKGTENRQVHARWRYDPGLETPDWLHSQLVE